MKLSDLETVLNIQIHNHDLFTQALTHRSYLNEDKNFKQSNERLEFLGDSVLSLLTSNEIFKRFPDLPEGKLTYLRSTLVRTETLAKVSQELKLGDYLFLSRGEEKEGGRNNPSLLANTFEAILGAIYLDQGIDTADKFLQQHLFPHIINFTNTAERYDYKSLLQEVIQEKNRVTPVYKVVKEEGPDHSKIFTVDVLAGNKILSRGQGKSKQEAEQASAKLALNEIK
jgi:ribonuclease-3